MPKRPSRGQEPATRRHLEPIATVAPVRAPRQALVDTENASPAVMAAQVVEALASEFSIDDVHGRILLKMLRQQLERAARARALIEHEGECTIDGRGRPRAHPACQVERDALAGARAALKQLQLDVLPRGAPGRPSTTSTIAELYGRPSAR